MGISALVICFWFLPQAGDPASGPFTLADIFQKRQRHEFAALLPESSRVKADLRPLLFDYGLLNNGQMLMAFDKIFERFDIYQAEITNSQSDTNYAWLEIYLSLGMREKATGHDYQATFAFYFKIAASRMAIDRWKLQDLF